MVLVIMWLHADLYLRKHLGVLKSHFQILCACQVTVISDLLQYWVENPSHKHLLHVAFLKIANDQLVIKLTAYLDVMINPKFNFCMPIRKEKSRSKNTYQANWFFFNLVLREQIELEQCVTLPHVSSPSGFVH